MVRRQARWWSVPIGLLGAALLASAVVPAGATANPRAAASPKAFSEGKWQGKLVYIADLDLDGLTASTSVNGTFDLTVSSTAISDGTFGFIGAGTGRDGEGSADITFAFEGPITGNGAAPVLTGGSGRVTGTATVEGYTVPFDVPMGPADFGSTQMTITSASCQVVEGRWAAEGKAVLEAAGGTVTGLGGRWSAVRVKDGGGDVPDDLLEEVNDLVAEAEGFLGGVKQGKFDDIDLFLLVKRAEVLNLALTRNNGCGDVPGSFRTVITQIITDVLLAMVENDGVFGAGAFADAIQAGLRVGSLGAGATGDGVADLRAGVLMVLTSKLDVAVAENDGDSMFSVAYGATMLGDKALAEEAMTAFKAAG